MWEQTLEPLTDDALDYKELLSDFKEYVNGQISGLGDGKCPLGSVEACRTKIEELAAKDGTVGAIAVVDLQKTMSRWHNACMAPKLLESTPIGKSTGTR